MSVHDTVAKLSAGAREGVERLYQQHVDGDLDWDQFLALSAAAITRQAHRAGAVADLSVAAELTRMSGTLKVPTGVELELQASVTEALQEQTQTQSFALDPVASMGVAGAAVVLAAYQDTAQSAMTRQGVEYWRREVEPNACEICQELADIILPTTHQFWHHKGCACVAVPVDPTERF